MSKFEKMADKYEGKTEGVELAYPSHVFEKLEEGLIDPLFTMAQRLAYAYCRDVQELCNILRTIPDREGDAESAYQLNTFYESVLCPCECGDGKRAVAVIGDEEGEVTITCQECGSEYVVKSRPKKK